MDKAHERTDKEIELIERQIDRIYAVQQKLISKLTERYFSKFEKADNEKKAKLDAGEITESEYRKWRQSTMMNGVEWYKFISDVCKIIHRTNVQAVALSNKVMPNVFVDNYNEVGKDIERQVREIQ